MPDEIAFRQACNREAEGIGRRLRRVAVHAALYILRHPWSAAKLGWLLAVCNHSGHLWYRESAPFPATNEGNYTCARCKMQLGIWHYGPTAHVRVLW